MRPKIPSETQKTFKDHLFSIEISRNTERQKTLVFDLDFEKNVLMPSHHLRPLTYHNTHTRTVALSPLSHVHHPLWHGQERHHPLSSSPALVIPSRNASPALEAHVIVAPERINQSRRRRGIGAFHHANARTRVGRRQTHSRTGSWRPSTTRRSGPAMRAVAAHRLDLPLVGMRDAAMRRRLRRRLHLRHLRGTLLCEMVA